MTPQLSEEIRAAYARDGFWINTASVLSADVRERAAAGLALVQHGGSDTGEEPDSGARDPGADPNALCKIEQPQLASHGLREALASRALGEVVAAATGADRVQVWWVQGLVKPATPRRDSATTVGWHQDQFYWGDWEGGSELLTAWLALSDVTADAGPMVFVPGSHQWGLLPGSDFYGQDQDALRAAIPIPEGQRWREVVDVLPPGGVSLHSQLLFHGSYPNVSSGPRLSLAIHMRTEKSTPRPGKWVGRYLDRPEICPVVFGG